MLLHYQILSRAQSRRTSYNKKDTIRVVEELGLHITKDGFIIEAEMVVSCRAEAIARRKDIDSGLRRIHRNVSYIFTFKE